MPVSMPLRFPKPRVARRVLLASWWCSWAMVLSAPVLAEETKHNWSHDGFAPPGSEAWVSDVPGYVRPAPGEHPRLFFRKGDVPALRQRAATPEGKAIIARLRHLLGGNGETFPTWFSKVNSHLPGPVPNESNHDPGSFSLDHAAGYGLLYQITGEQRYADFGRKAFELLMSGTRDAVFSGYSLVKPNPGCVGPSWAVAAIGYDLCYDGWDPAFRAKAAKAFLSVKSGGQKTVDLKASASDSDSIESLGSAIAAIAIAGDPGTEDEDIWGAWMQLMDVKAKRIIYLFGDHGAHPWPYPTGALPWFRVAKIACGRDYLTQKTQVSWASLRWLMELIPTKTGPRFPDRLNKAGVGAKSVIGSDFLRSGWDNSARFLDAFATVDPKYHGALLWTYQQAVEPAELAGKWNGLDQEPFQAGKMIKGERTFDVVSQPWTAVLALASWPIGVQPADPALVMPKAVKDETFNLITFRNRWKDANDTILTVQGLQTPKAGGRLSFTSPKEMIVGPCCLWTQGDRMTFGSFTSDTNELVTTPTGGILTAKDTCVAFDASGASGAEALIALIGVVPPGPGRGLAVHSVEVAGTKVQVLLCGGQAPAPVVTGNTIAVGSQTITVTGSTLQFAK
ncbi:hypothetical protein LBMAG53_35720 [Planctomycetota bacterium]|nr:hypothetical protein LBMAG53_35720 [Planctomycetota bacterium]